MQTIPMAVAATLPAASGQLKLRRKRLAGTPNVSVAPVTYETAGSGGGVTAAALAFLRRRRRRLIPSGAPGSPATPAGACAVAVPSDAAWWPFDERLTDRIGIF